MENINATQKEKIVKNVKEKRIDELTPELLSYNFRTWKERLQKDLEIKFHDIENRDEALSKAKEFVKHLPLYNCMRLGGVSFFVDNPSLLNTKELRLKAKNISDISASGTNNDDIEYGRDEFIFLKYGHAMFAGNDRLAVGVSPSVLDRSGTLVTLEDLSLIRFRVKEQNKNISSLSWENACEQQKKEIWSGIDFRELFPYFITLSFNDPQEYYSKPLKPEFFEILRDSSISTRDRIASFEIMVPGRIEMDEILFFGVGSESGFYPQIKGLEQLEQRLNKPVIKIPKNTKNEELSFFLNGRYRDIVFGDE